MRIHVYDPHYDRLLNGVRALGYSSSGVYSFQTMTEDNIAEAAALGILHDESVIYFATED